MRQLQILVPAESATFELVKNGKHFGQVACPFCEKMNVLLGPKTGAGLAWVDNPCAHSQGAAAGNGFDSTILFRGK